MSSGEKEQQQQQQLELADVIGEGAFGKVFRGGTAGQNEVAVKLISVARDEPASAAITQEVERLRAARHVNIASYLSSFACHSETWIVRELCTGGSISDLVRLLSRRSILAPPRATHTKNAVNGDVLLDGGKSSSIDRQPTVPVVPEQTIAYVLSSSLAALQYLHAAIEVAHGHVTCANILVSGDGIVKLSDFGLSERVADAFKARNTFRETQPHWTPPEVVTTTTPTSERREHYKGDLWSLGICAIEMAEGRPPLADLHPMQVLVALAKGDPPRVGRDCRARLSLRFHQFLSMCLVKNPSERADARALFAVIADECDDTRERRQLAAMMASLRADISNDLTGTATAAAVAATAAGGATSMSVDGGTNDSTGGRKGLPSPDAWPRRDNSWLGSGPSSNPISLRSRRPSPTSMRRDAGAFADEGAAGGSTTSPRKKYDAHTVMLGGSTMSTMSSESDGGTSAYSGTFIVRPERHQERLDIFFGRPDAMLDPQGLCDAGHVLKMPMLRSAFAVDALAESLASTQPISGDAGGNAVNGASMDTHDMARVKALATTLFPRSGGVEGNSDEELAIAEYVLRAEDGVGGFARTLSSYVTGEIDENDSQMHGPQLDMGVRRQRSAHEKEFVRNLTSVVRLLAGSSAETPLFGYRGLEAKD